MEKKKKPTKREIVKKTNYLLENALVLVPRTNDVESFHSNGITVHITKDWAVVSRMYVKTSYTADTSTYHMLRAILELQKKKDSGEQMEDWEETGLVNGLIFVQSLAVSDFFSENLDFAFNTINGFLEFSDKLLKEAQEAELPEDDGSALSELAAERNVIEELKNDK